MGNTRGNYAKNVRGRLDEHLEFTIASYEHIAFSLKNLAGK